MTSDILFKLDLNSELPADVKEIAIKQGENEDTKCELIEQLRRLIFEEGKCTPHRTDDEYLIKFLRARYWKVELSYQLLCNYCDFRENNRNYYEKVSCIDLIRLADDKLLTVTPYREQNGRRILIIRFGTWDPSKISVDDIFKLIMIILEMGSMEPISQVTGGVGIFDLGGVSMSHVLHLSPSVAQKIMALIVTSSPFKTTAIHVVNQSWVFNAIINIFKPLLSARMRERLFIHGSDMSSLQKHIDVKYLPKRYGGVHEDYPYAKWCDGLKDNNKLKLQLEQLGYTVENEEDIAAILK